MWFLFVCIQKYTVYFVLHCRLSMIEVKVSETVLNPNYFKKQHADGLILLWTRIVTACRVLYVQTALFSLPELRNRL